MFSEHTSAEVILFFTLYGLTGAMPLFAAVYLLLRRGNAFAPDTTPPLRLRHWAAAFFAVAALGHVWWLLFYIYSNDLHSACYVALAVLDSVTMLTTIAGTLLAMLQDRRRPVWPVFAAMTSFVAMGVVQILYPDGPFMNIASVYILSLYALFTVYMAFAVRRYGRWLNDNYADLENKKVWLSQTVSLVCLLLFILYALVDTNTILLYLLHVLELALFGLLLWRVETLPTLDSSLATDSLTPDPSPIGEGSIYHSSGSATEELTAPLPTAGGAGALDIELLLADHCVSTQLYLKHGISLQDLAHAVGTNRSYLSQYFSRQGIAYNSYINNLRINHFISRYEEAVAAGQSVVAQDLAYESGFSTYRTFARAFTQRMGQSVTEWMHQQPRKGSA